MRAGEVCRWTTRGLKPQNPGWLLHIVALFTCVSNEDVVIDRHSGYFMKSFESSPGVRLRLQLTWFIFRIKLRSVDTEPF
jgi:hypothetical protein